MRRLWNLVLNIFLRWRDDRLEYSTNVYPKTLGGEAWLADKIWTPNVYIENEV